MWSEKMNKYRKLEKYYKKVDLIDIKSTQPITEEFIFFFTAMEQLTTLTTCLAIKQFKHQLES
jgi:hypothetical protein